MPTYDYTCRTCRRTIELKLGFDDTHPTTCHDCGGALARVYTAPALHLPSSPGDPLLARGADFLSKPDRFRDSMKAFEHETGLGLTSAELDGAIDRLGEGT